MKLTALMPVRNEGWCLGLTLRAALTWCDEVVVLLHACTDNSEEIVKQIDAEHPRRIVWGRESGAWDEMRHRQQILEIARHGGATHIALIDADEILTGNFFRDANCPPQRFWDIPTAQMLQLPGYNLRNGIHKYHANGIWGQRWFSVAFADDAMLGWAGDSFHHREPHGKRLIPYQPIAQGEGGIMHLWGADPMRLRAKHALYKLTERIRWPQKSVDQINGMYNLWRTPYDCYVMYPQQRQFLEEWTFKSVPDSWWKPYEPWMKYLNLSQTVWQIAECQRLIEQHGRDKFAGLDLFGVV